MLKKLYLHHFRNYGEKRLDFFSDKVLLCGANGIGKTNILEAIHYLGIMRSFKNAPVREVVQNQQDSFTLLALLENDGRDRKIQIDQHKNGDRICMIDGVAEKKASALLHNFRSVIFAPEDRLVISGTAGIRRRFFDILISLENSAYLHDLQQYKHALAQRNTMLKKGMKKGLDPFFLPFEELMAFHGARIMEQRALYADIVSSEVQKLAAGNNFKIRFNPDWKNTDIDYIKHSLKNNRERDFLRGFTSCGVQLDDFEITLNDLPMRSYASSGQIRIYSLYLKMAEFNLSCAGGGKPVALVDDVTGELDNINKEKFFEMLSNAEQTFFTFTAVQNISASQQVVEL
ncbi:MAG: DNA replication and repair protein RecF [Lentisphaeria bacterium]|nr:DNA replication and repair protein RecF [Lentisphaeria bacterium]